MWNSKIRSRSEESCNREPKANTVYHGIQAGVDWVAKVIDPWSYERTRMALCRTCRARYPAPSARLRAYIL